MCCELYFRRAINSSPTAVEFISKPVFCPLSQDWDDETKTDKEGDSYGN